MTQKREILYQGLIHQKNLNVYVFKKKKNSCKTCEAKTDRTERRNGQLHNQC